VRVYFAIDRYHTGFAFSDVYLRIGDKSGYKRASGRNGGDCFSLTGLFQGEDDQDH